jgi:tetratricopeptide (TPR) repeat protein
MPLVAPPPGAGLPAASRALAVVLVLALCARLAVLWQLHAHPLLQPRPGLDGEAYLALARLVTGGDLLAGDQVYFLSPFYTYFVALVLALSGGSVVAVLLAQVLLGTVAVWLVARTAGLWFGARGVLLAAVLAAGTGYFAFNEILVLQSAVDPFLTALGLWLIGRAWHSGRAMEFAWAGGALALQVLNRPNVLAWAAAAMGATLVGEWVVRNAECKMQSAKCRMQDAEPAAQDPAGSWGGRTRLATPAAALLAGLVTVLAPVAVRNYVVAGQLAVVSSHGGLNFYIGNHAGATGAYTNVPDITPSVAGQVTDMRRVAGRALGREVTDVEASEWFYQRAWGWIREQPKAAAGLFLRKLAFVFNATDLPLNESYAYYATDESPVLRMLLVGPWLLLPLGLAGVWLGRAGAAPRAAVAWWLLTLFIPVYAVSVAAFFVSGRYRLPLLVAACVLAPGAILALWDRWRARAWRPLGAAAGLLAALALPVYLDVGLDNGLGDWRAEMVLHHIEAGRDAEAAATLDRALAVHRTPGLVLFRAGRAYMRRGTPAAALPLLERAAALEPSRREFRIAAGEALLVLGRPGEATAHLQAAMASGVGDGSVLITLARALAESGRPADALRSLTSIPAPEALSASTQLEAGRLALDLGDPRLAEPFLGRAVALAGDNAQAREAFALSLAMQGRPADAIPMMEAACRLDPSSASARLNLAVLYAETGRPAEARALAAEALRLRPDYAEARRLLQALGK